MVAYHAVAMPVLSEFVPVVVMTVAEVAIEREVAQHKEAREEEAVAPERERVPFIEVCIVLWRLVVCDYGWAFIGIVVVYYGLILRWRHLNVALCLGRTRCYGQPSRGVKCLERAVRIRLAHRQLARTRGGVYCALNLRYDVRGDREVRNPAVFRGYADCRQACFRRPLRL